jgi:hypothetical protein
MRRWTTLPLRQRLTLVFAVGTAVTLAAFGVFVYLRTAADLLDTVEAGLRSRAAILVVDARKSGPASVDVGSGSSSPMRRSLRSPTPAARSSARTTSARGSDASDLP